MFDITQLYQDTFLIDVTFLRKHINYVSVMYAAEFNNSFKSGIFCELKHFKMRNVTDCPMKIPVGSNLTTTKNCKNDADM